MEMRSVANDKISLGLEPARPKKARKSTASAKRKEFHKYTLNDDDGMCGLEIYEVVGNVKDEAKEGTGFGQSQDQSESYKKFEDCEESIVVGNEVLLRITNQKETPKRSKEDDLMNLAYILETQNSGNVKDMAPVGKTPDDDIRLPTSTVKNTISSLGPNRTGESNNPGPVQGTPLVAQVMRDSDYSALQGNGGTKSNLYSSAKKANDVNSKQIEKKLVSEVNATARVPDQGAAVEKVRKVSVESRGTDTGTDNMIGIMEQNIQDKNDEDQNSGDKVGQGEVMERCNGDEEMVVSSGSAWNTEAPSGSGLSGPVRNFDEYEFVDEEEDLIGELKMTENGSLQFIRRFKKDAVMGNGAATEILGAKLAEKSVEEDKGAVQDEEIGSLMEEDGVEEGGKRKRMRKGGGTKKSSLKKRKTEKPKKKTTNDQSDGEGSSGRSNGEKNKKDSAKASSSRICDQSTLEETIDRVASGHLSLPFLESLRGEIKVLSRADLEELIVQKLCEVITERSMIGHLRKRAEALERGQERWKEKVHLLTKQIKEMEMVMNNYMREVRRHTVAKCCQVAPIRITRSVGLQVNFTSTPSNLAKITPKSCGDAHQDDKGPKIMERTLHVSAVHFTQIPNKNISILPSTTVKESVAIDQKNKLSPKSGLTITLQPASSSSDAQIATKKASQIQQPKVSILPVPMMAPHGSNLIDLTQDEDRQAQYNGGPDTSEQSLNDGPADQFNIVNHTQSAQNPTLELSLFLPKSTSPPCCSSTTTNTTNEIQDQDLAVASSSGQTPHMEMTHPPIYKVNSSVQPAFHQQQGVANSRHPVAKIMKHPAALPPPPSNQIHKLGWKQLPPRPSLKISKGDAGIVLSWNMPLGVDYETIISYQLFAYQESESPPCPSMWKRVGDIKALPLPMACTLTQFLTGHKYYFAVRAVDIHSRVGPFSFPSSIALFA